MGKRKKKLGRKPNVYCNKCGEHLSNCFAEGQDIYCVNEGCEHLMEGEIEATYVVDKKTRDIYHGDDD